MGPYIVYENNEIRLRIFTCKPEKSIYPVLKLKTHGQSSKVRWLHKMVTSCGKKTNPKLLIKLVILLQYEIHSPINSTLIVGVAACYRGFRLYDSNSTKALVKKWVDFYKTYRDIITSDIIHVKRPDMQVIITVIKGSIMHFFPRVISTRLHVYVLQTFT